MIHSASSTRRVGLDRLRIDPRYRRHDPGSPLLSPARVTRTRSASPLIQWTVSTGSGSLTVDAARRATTELRVTRRTNRGTDAAGRPHAGNWTKTR